MSSKGALIIAQTLKSWNLPFKGEVEVKINEINLYFDFYFVHKGRVYYVEYDGIQHFKITAPFQSTQEDLLRQQYYDILKTLYCLQYGYGLIRIDHTQFKRIKHHLGTALGHPRSLYLSTPELYTYLIPQLRHDKQGEERLAFIIMSLACACHLCYNLVPQTVACVTKMCNSLKCN